jgi:hypothetical protein
MPNPIMSSLVLPIKNTSTGEVSNQTFDLSSGDGSTILTTAAKTGSIQSSIANTIAKDTSMDSVVQILLNNDVTENNDISNIKDSISEYIEVIGNTPLKPNGYTRGAFFLATDGKLYMVLSTISSSTTIVVNTNCEEITIANALSVLNKRLIPDYDEDTSGTHSYGFYLSKLHAFYNSVGLLLNKERLKISINNVVYQVLDANALTFYNVKLQQSGEIKFTYIDLGNETISETIINSGGVTTTDLSSTSVPSGIPVKVFF